MPTCTALHSFGVDAIGLGHVACSSDCYGASITDATLALHCAVNALAIMRKTGGKGRMKVAVLTALWSNASWCIFGAHVWLQPGGWREDPFDLLFRLNGISQAVLVFSWCVGGGRVGWAKPLSHQSSHATLRKPTATTATLRRRWWIFAEILRGLESVPSLVHRFMMPFAAMHAFCFCLRNLDSSIEEYVLCGGARPPAAAPHTNE